MIFSGKGSLSVYKCSIIYHHTRNQKKNNDQFLRKNAQLTQTDRQTGNSDFIGPSIGQESNKMIISVPFLATWQNSEYLSVQNEHTAAEIILELNSQESLGLQPDVYLRPCQTFMIELLCENS